MLMSHVVHLSFKIGNRRAIKGLFNAVMLGLFVNISANFVLLNYALPLFEMSGSQMNVEYSTILLAVFQLSGCICSATLSDKIGRKCLMIISLLGSALALLTFAVYVYLRNMGVDVSEYHWMPVAMVLIDLFMASMGIVPLAALSAIEVLPPKVGQRLQSQRISSLLYDSQQIAYEI